MMTPRDTRPMKFPFSTWYNPYAMCEFHGEAGGHSIEECKVFKEKVQEMIENGLLAFGKGLSMVNDPLP